MRHHFLSIIAIILIFAAAVYIWNRFFNCEHFQGKGTNWTAAKAGTGYIVSINNHAELVSALEDFVKANKITAGNITGIGAVNRAVLRFFDPQTKKYVDKTVDGQMEITNLTGNISTMNGKEYIHLHITLGNSKYQGIAGHLLSADINGAGEFYIQNFPHTHIERTYNPEVGLNFYDFNK